ncbi:hypothetical protein M1P97_19985 [Parabacteroides sp. GYB001]|uniref:hypothetical protein n=1 Tax=Parabacteroides leei TaxID=2939491 RepID=UPI0020171FD4|nr:hypothetical protein [Parabacteroides leei]MCL3853567.1 hypothetical protein [Parabacteroides leei]
MKSNSLTVSSSQSQEHGIFSWITVQKFYNAMPLGITECKSTNEAKMYTCVLFAVLSAILLPLLIPAIYLYVSAKKGGKK